MKRTRRMGQMKVEVRLFASLASRQPDPPVLDLPQGALVADLLSALGLAADAALVILLDGQPAEAQSLLHDQAQISLLPLVDGG